MGGRTSRRASEYPGQGRSRTPRLRALPLVSRVIYSTPLVLTLVVASAIPVRGESSVGVTGGMTLSGDQDVKIVQPRVGNTESRDVIAAIGPLGGTTASL